MRIRVAIATLLCGSILAVFGSLAAPASAKPDGFGTCHINVISTDGNGDVSIDASGRPIECYY